jgi:hypothetical protein
MRWVHRRPSCVFWTRKVTNSPLSLPPSKWCHVEGRKERNNTCILKQHRRYWRCKCITNTTKDEKTKTCKTDNVEDAHMCFQMCKPNRIFIHILRYVCVCVCMYIRMYVCIYVAKLNVGISCVCIQHGILYAILNRMQDLLMNIHMWLLLCLCVCILYYIYYHVCVCTCVRVCA